MQWIFGFFFMFLFGEASKQAFGQPHTTCVDATLRFGLGYQPVAFFLHFSDTPPLRSFGGSNPLSLLLSIRSSINLI